MNESDFKDPTKENLVRIRMYTWLGLKPEVQYIFKHLRDGYGFSEKFLNNIDLPSNMFYHGIIILISNYFFY